MDALPPSNSSGSARKGREQGDATTTSARKDKGHQLPKLPAPSAAFVAEKGDVIKKLWAEEEDKSRAGHADPQIVPLLRTMNAKRHLYTGP
jgi:hypothetical protein